MWHHAPAGYQCPFCLYAEGGENEHVRQHHVVERTAATLTFVAPKWWPNNPGAVLVIPTAHVENLYDVPDGLGEAIFGACRRAAVAMKHAYQCAGTSTRQHNEPAGNQDVWHFHVHVFPRYSDDRLYRSRGGWASAEAMDEYADRLRLAYSTPGSCD